MLDPTAFAQYGQTLNLSDAALTLVQTIRSSEPVRRVQSRVSNVCGRYPSRKMGRVIQAESRTVELVAIRCAYEFEPTVLEYWDQPCQIELTYLARNGRLVHVQHTPDFFVLRPSRTGWEEWKPHEQLETLAEKMPQRYQRRPDGCWRCPPGEAYAAQFGLYYQVRTAAEFAPTYQRNVALLEDYLLDAGQHADQALQHQLVAAVQEHPGVTLAELQGHFSSDALLGAIAAGLIYADLAAAPLVHADQVLLFASAAVAQALPDLSTHTAALGVSTLDDLRLGTLVWWDERVWQIVNLGREHIALLSDQADAQLLELSRSQLEQLLALGRVSLPTAAAAAQEDAVLERIRHASPAALERASARVQAVEALLAGQQVATAYAARTLRDYKRRYLAAQATLGSGFVGLLDANAQKGNRLPRLCPDSLAQLEQFITQSYETLKQKSVLAVYGEYLLACEAQSISPASYTTFAKHVKRRPRAEQVKRRQGPRAAYQTGPQIWWLAYATPRHGDFPWQFAHCDHTQLNLELVCAQTGRLLGRPWLTLLLDAFSRRIVALYLSFDPPSYRSCMAVLVACVQRHQRLPQHLIVDNGPEFGSTYFETLLAYYEVTKLARPTAEPRVGSVIERLFRTSETEFVHNLQGNTQIMKLVRQVTQEVNPKQQAIWTLERLYDCFCVWSYEVYDQLPHSTLGQSPRAAYLAGLAATGVRQSRHVSDDETFRLLMLPSTKRGHAKVIPGSGVKVQYLYYWCDAFRQPQVEGTVVPVRYDPFNAGIAYAYVNGRWERCISERYAVFQGRSERELMLATVALRQQKRLDRQQFDINAKTLATFLASVEGQEVVLAQQLQDHAAHHIRTSIFGRSQGAATEAWQSASAEGASSSPARPTVNLNELEQYGDLTL